MLQKSISRPRSYADNPMASEWVSALESVRNRMRSASFDDAAESGQHRYYTLEPVQKAAPEDWQLNVNETGVAGNERPLTLLTAPLAIAGAVIGAALGIAVWALGAYVTGQDVVFLALVPGILAGVGAVVLSRGCRGNVVQLMTVAATLVGLVLGKYLAYHMLANSMNGTGIFAVLNTAVPTSADALSGILRTVQFTLGPDDAMMFIVAVWLAWRMAASTGVQRRAKKA